MENITTQLSNSVYQITSSQTGYDITGSYTVTPDGTILGFTLTLLREGAKVAAMNLCSRGNLSNITEPIKSVEVLDCENFTEITGIILDAYNNIMNQYNNVASE